MNALTRATFLVLLSNWSANAQVCTRELAECADGTMVGRVPPDCDFEACPDGGCTIDLAECPDGSSVGRVLPECQFDVCPGGFCSLDIFTCPDGSTVGRVPPDCEFQLCGVCPLDILECPDGTSVGRVPPECEFEDCPTEAPTESPNPRPTDPETEQPTPAPTDAPTQDDSTPAPSAAPSTRPSATPSTSPSALPSTLPSMPPNMEPSSSSPPSALPTMMSVVNCSEYQMELAVPGLEDMVTMEYVVNINFNESLLMDATATADWNTTFFYATMSIKLTYQGEGWLAFAVSPDGGMLGADAIIGTPDDGNVSKYLLTFDDNAPGYLVSPEMNQTLMEANITQQDGITVLEFTRFLEEEGEIPINGTGLNYFLVAYGTSNELGYHGEGRSSFNLTLEPCIPDFDVEEIRDFVEELVEEVLEGTTEEVGDSSTGSVTVVVDKGIEKPAELESGAAGTTTLVAILSLALGMLFL